MDGRIKTDKGVELIKASPVIVRSTARPVRIVMYEDNNQFITHEELLTSQSPEDHESSCSFVHHCFYAGGYFPYKCEARPFASISRMEALHNATSDFKERVRKLAELIHD